MEVLGGGRFLMIEVPLQVAVSLRWVFGPWTRGLASMSLRQVFD